MDRVIAASPCIEALDVSLGIWRATKKVNVVVGCSPIIDWLDYAAPV